MHTYRSSPTQWTLLGYGFLNGFGGDGLGRTNYVGVAGFSGVIGVPPNDALAGVFTNRSNITMGHITAADGASNTLMFGETLGDTPFGARMTSDCWMGVGALPTAWGLPVTQSDTGWWHFNSRHPGVVQFCFCDGSVRSVHSGITQDTAWVNFIYASAWHDGQVTDLDSISN
jgi:prepilin-type processing-associated H-X9-DG protein